MKRLCSKACLALISVWLLANSSTNAAILYWDITADVIGAGGATPAGTWGTTWNASADGSGPLVAWVAGSDAVFSADTDATGAFTVTLSAAQTAASVTVEEGTVSLAGSGLTVGAGTVTVNAGAKFSIPSTLNLVATAGANLNLDGSTFRGTMNGAGSTFVDADFSINIGPSGGTLETANTGANSSIFQGTLKGPGNTLIKTGSGEFRYQGVNLPNTTFGKLVVNEGLYRLGFNSSISDERGFGAVPASPLADAITISNGASIGTSFTAANSVLHVNRGLTLGPGGGAINGNMTIPGSITGIGSLSHLTTGTLILSGANDYSGITFVTLGVVQVASATGLGSTAAGTQVASGAELRFDGVANSFTILEPIQIAGGVGGGASAINVQNAASITFGGPVTLSGDAAVTVSGTSTAVYTNAASFTSLANQNLLLQGGALSSGNGGSILGTISLGTGSLTKTQGGRWVLYGSNDYSGGTYVGAGTLQINNAEGSGTGSGSVFVTNAATLSGTGIISGTVSIASGATLAPGAGLGTLTLLSSPALGGSVAAEINKAGATLTSDKLVVSGQPLTYGGTLAITVTGDALAGGDTVDLFDAIGFDGSFASFTTSPLGIGLNWYLGNLTNDGTITVNTWPTANTANVSRAPGSGVQISIADLIAAATSDPDGDARAFVSIGAATNETGSVSNDATYIYYDNTNALNDTFTYNIADGRGGFRQGTITVNVSGSPSGTATIETSGVGPVTVKFQGTPDAHYDIERSQDLIIWVTVAADVVADPTGAFQFVDAAPPQPQAFYRSKLR